MNPPPLRRLLAATTLLAALATTACTGDRHPDPGVVPGGDAEPTPVPTPTTAHTESLLESGPVFGIALPDISEASVAATASSAGCRPSIINRFVSVASGLSLRTLVATPGTPMLSLEPWHSGQGPRQSDFTLRATINGRWDDKYRAIATSILGYGGIVLVRFGHEMNGDWYPWGVGNGNTAADFVAAWQHVVQLFREVGTTNALWVWSPNILRGASSTQVSQFWPGPGYVDIVGMTGYGVREASPELTFGPTLTQIQELTDKPVLLTETGAQADAAKSQWIEAFGPWLAGHPQVMGFVWFQSGRDDDWRFDDTPENLALFKDSLKTANVRC